MKMQKKNMLWLWISVCALLCGVLSFFITVYVYDSSAPEEKIALAIEEQEEKQQEAKAEALNLVADVKDANDGIKKAENDSHKIFKEEDTSYETTISMVTKLDDESKSEAISLNDNTELLVETVSLSVNEETEDKPELPDFIWPTSGEIGMAYAVNELIYSKTLDEWITHPGIDILGEEAQPVKAIRDGIVESVKLDPRYGNTIIIQHENGYQSIYANLSTIDLVFAGQKVKQGDIISGIGKGFGFECEEKPHLHFELLKDEEKIDFLKEKTSY